MVVIMHGAYRKKINLEVWTRQFQMVQARLIDLGSNTRVI